MLRSLRWGLTGDVKSLMTPSKRYKQVGRYITMLHRTVPHRHRFGGAVGEQWRRESLRQCTSIGWKRWACTFREPTYINNNNNIMPTDYEITQYFSLSFSPLSLSLALSDCLSHSFFFSPLRFFTIHLYSVYLCLHLVASLSHPLLLFTLCYTDIFSSTIF